MTSKQKALVEKIAESNPEWAAQQMLEQLKPGERHNVAYALRKLDKILFKSWAKDMTLTELLEALDLTKPYEEKEKIIW